jgi:hypothetical protein
VSLQRQLWDATPKEIEKRLTLVEEELDRTCSQFIARGKDARSVAAELRSFHTYDGGAEVFCPLALGEEKWLVLYNISVGASDFAPMLTAFAHERDGVVKIFSRRLWDETATGLKSLRLPFKKLAMIRDSTRESTAYLCLAGQVRVAAYFIIVDIDWAGKQTSIRGKRFFELSKVPTKATDDIRIEDKEIVVISPSKSGVLHEGDGALTNRATFKMCEGNLTEVSTEVLNPWYMQLVLAIVSREKGDQNGFLKIVADANAWNLISKPSELMCLGQRRTGAHTAEVVLGMTAPTYRLTFQLEELDGTWRVMKVTAEGKLPEADDITPESPGPSQTIPAARSSARSAAPITAVSESECGLPNWAMFVGAAIVGVLLGILIGRTRLRATKHEKNE